ncbi:MAG: T9SS type A sorting domain-containing protein, partial [Chitinophagales bacterium]|nr:T9SS type A sorting domain-containing protein [Chitinophagales bacterium]
HYSIATVVAPLTCKAWDGFTGGVLVFFADVLNISDSITVAGKGFRGAIPQTGGCATFPSGAYFSSSSDNTAGKKGEGIHIFQPSYENGRGKLANGGGGGNDHNSGGGGGANSGAGGTGGQRWKSLLACPGLNPGVGGDSLYNYFQNRLFLGGGGGAGHQNNNNTLPGGNGGGIVIIKTNAIIGDNQIIDARGEDVDTFMDGDGGSGGGAGGTVVLIGNTSNFSSITIDISGGNGESVNNDFQDYCSGAGGGGGGGAAYFNGNPSLMNIIRHGGSAGGSFNSTINCNAYVAKNGTMGSIFTTGSIPSSHFIVASNPFTLAKLNVSKDTGICKGQSVELFLKSCTKVSWTPKTFLNRDTGSTVISTPDSNITYTVTGIDSCGNARLFNIAILVDNVKLGLNKDTVLCTGQTVALKIDNGSNTIWTPNTFLDRDTGNAVLSSPTTNIQYFVQTQNKCGIGTTDSVKITIKSTSLNMTKDTSICGGKTLVLKIDEGKNALWTPNTQINKDTGIAIIATPSQSRKYYVEAFDACNFRKYRDSVSITVVPAMTLNIAKDSICLGDSITVKANNRLTYKWNNQLGTDQFVVKGIALGTQTVCVVGSNASCKDSICFNVKTIKCSLSISKNGNHSDIQLYPNPMSTSLNIDVLNLELPMTMSIFDITNRKIQTLPLTEKMNKIELKLSTGIYIAVFETKGMQFTRRFEVE